jgi:hypothetical protein
VAAPAPVPPPAPLEQGTPLATAEPVHSWLDRPVTG